MKKMKTRRRGGILGLVPLLMVVAGLVLIGYQFIGEVPASAKAPDSSTMKLTVPEMSRVENVPVYDGPANDREALHDGALHVRNTGFPWQSGANVYIAGHRIGFPGTKSSLIFFDLGSLENGDEIYLTDASGTRYTYEVFRKFVVDPHQLEAARPVAGRNVVSLQTCTLPDYSKRLIVQGELVSVS